MARSGGFVDGHQVLPIPENHMALALCTGHNMLEAWNSPRTVVIIHLVLQINFTASITATQMALVHE